MQLHELSAPPGARRQKKRIGRGHGSGRVKTGGKGTKGQKARSGPNPGAFFEGGQNPWTMRIPHKRGFNIGRFRKTVQVVNLRDLEKRFNGGAVVDLAQLKALGLVDDVSGKEPVKLLGEGSLSKALTVTVHYASRSARQAVEAAGGTVTLLRGSAEAKGEPGGTDEAGDAATGAEGAQSAGDAAAGAAGATPAGE